MLSDVLNLSMFELIILQLGGIVLGMAIHFFITSRRSLKSSSVEYQKIQRQFEDWKLKYFNEAEVKEKELADVKLQLHEANENSQIYNIELEELRKQNKKLLNESAKDLTDIRQQLNDANEKARTYSAEADELRRQNEQLQNELQLKSNANNNEINNELNNLRTQLNEANSKSNNYIGEIETLRRKNEQLQNEAATKAGANEMDTKNQEITDLKNQLWASQENNQAQAAQIEHLLHQLGTLQTELDNKNKYAPPKNENEDYISRLVEAQSSLLEHSQKINLLLNQIDVVKEKEEKQLALSKENEELKMQVKDMQYLMEEKENEINKIRQREHLTIEMTSMLDSAYNEFNILQGKMHKLESQVSASRLVNVEYEDLKEAHYHTMREFEHAKVKLQAQTAENQEINRQLNETEDKLKEANFQRQQLQKRVSYLEELTNDLQIISEANKKLQSQIKGIGELESKLDLISEERDHLLRQQQLKQQ